MENKQYDFYYSEQQDRNAGCFSYRGIKVTEIVNSGVRPIGNYSDYALVYSGEFNPNYIDCCEIKCTT